MQVPWIELDPGKPAEAKSLHPPFAQVESSAVHVTVRAGEALYLPALWCADTPFLSRLDRFSRALFASATDGTI